MIQTILRLFTIQTEQKEKEELPEKTRILFLMYKMDGSAALSYGGRGPNAPTRKRN